MERRRFSQTMASEWQTAFVVSHKMPWCALLTAVKNYNKSLENCKRPRPNVQDQDFMIQDQDFHFCPRDQDPGLEDFITGNFSPQEPLMIKTRMEDPM